MYDIASAAVEAALAAGASYADARVMESRTEAMARLTQTQLLICNLAGTGSTNRAIGEHLGITVKAVEWHLSHAYKKLGIRGRSELPRVLRLP